MSFIPVCAVPFTNSMFVPCLFDLVEVEVSNTVQTLVAISSVVACDIVRQSYALHVPH